MTWNEFKEWVDNQLSTIGEDGNVEIAWIDISNAANMRHRETRVELVSGIGGIGDKKRLMID